MDKEARKKIKECIEKLTEHSFKDAYHNAAYAAGYLHEYPELVELLEVIARY